MSSGTDQKRTLLDLLESGQMPPGGLPMLNTAVEGGSGSASGGGGLDPTSKGRVGSITAAEGRRASGVAVDEQRRPGGLERRESGLQTPHTPDRAFLLGFLEGVAKGGK